MRAACVDSEKLSTTTRCCGATQERNGLVVGVHWLDDIPYSGTRQLGVKQQDATAWS